MLSNVFSGVNPSKEHPVKRGNDGYEKSIERISREIYLDDTVSVKKAKSRV